MVRRLHLSAVVGVFLLGCAAPSSPPATAPAPPSDRPAELPTAVEADEEVVEEEEVAEILWLDPVEPEEYFGVHRLERRVGEVEWEAFQPERRVLWDASRLSPARRGVSAQICERRDGSWRLEVMGAYRGDDGHQWGDVFTDVLDYPDLTFVTEGKRRNSSQTRDDWTFQCYHIGGQSRFEEYPMIYDLETFEEVELDLGGLTGEFTGSSIGETISIRSPEEGWSATVNRITGEVTEREPSATVELPPGFEALVEEMHCHPTSVFGDRVVTSCFRPGDGYRRFVWNEATREAQLLTRYPESVGLELARHPFTANESQVEVFWDRERARFVHLGDDEILRWVGRGVPRDGEILGISPYDGTWEARWYDLNDGSYEVLRTYDDCPGVLGKGVANIQEGAERFVVIACVEPDTGNYLYSTLIWSEVLDRETGRVWRGNYTVSDVTADGEVVITDVREFGEWSNFGRVWRLEFGTP